MSRIARDKHVRFHCAAAAALGLMSMLFGASTPAAVSGSDFPADSAFPAVPMHSVANPGNDTIATNHVALAEYNNGHQSEAVRMWRSLAAAQMAAVEAGRPELGEITEGPTAITFGYDDAVASAKALTEHLRAERLNISILGGWMDGHVLTAAQVEEIATLPPKEQLIADFMAKMQGPLYGFASLIQATTRNFYGLIEARANQLEQS